MEDRINIYRLRPYKEDGQRFAVLTAYNAPTVATLNKARITVAQYTSAILFLSSESLNYEFWLISRERHTVLT